MNHLYKIIFLSFSSMAFSQSPGGVGEVSLWLKSDAGRSATLSYKDYSNNQHTISVETDKNKPKYSLLNYNDALDFDGTSNFLKIPYVMETLNKVNLFMIYQNKNTDRESALLSTDFSGEKEMYYSTANLYRYNNEQINNIEPRKLDSTASLSMYSKFDVPSGKIGDVLGSSGKSNIYIGKDAGTRNWSAFKGKLPEFFIYRKILTQNERDRVNSYLAIKYGITIPMTEYLSSKSKKVWKKEDYADYPENVAGIGIDQYSGLYQKQSTSTSENKRLIIAGKVLADNNKVNTAQFPDQTFLIWGNSRDGLELGHEMLGQQLLKRKWKIRLSGEKKEESFPTEVVFYIKDIIPVIPEGKNISLVIDRSGKGDFNSTDLETYSAGSIDDKGFAHFKDVVFDKDLSGTDVFTFALGSKLLLAKEIIQASCNNNFGSLKINIQGGSAPYKILLTKDNVSVQNQSSQNPKVNFNNLEAGKYTIEIVDKTNTSSRFSFDINNFASLDGGLAENYTLPPNGFIELDASKNIDNRGTHYQWSSNNGFTSTRPNVKLYEPGEYTIKATASDGCVKISKITVTQSLESGIIIFPNPTHAGENFTIRARLSKTEDINIKIFDMSGRLAKERKESGKSFYEIKESLLVGGTYVVIVETLTQKKTFKLIIN
ncbi:hypothetical protein C1637_24100 [Chryseobacterium lactis]|uniref:T9SS C-terminal target domain-containing protein n=1 Tax=Chryseobacterium lactis TaxID=1241981 RepID=A0A3G6RHH0_CHRLC|nr:T9SS type A sorting domain-containing protein [Chryseobacterium lactis]AZA83243.1 T9SS C-terminal target domain-containing protein [Chryseobacterium lactis]AZB03628.1 T9SS C-terminal target domain-containing protein [Chryseobacterium lactis]PNW11162.1 hypothetical protein C1637_24100 [Chryseobacterium lactis]